jgi:hypothetical protein
MPLTKVSFSVIQVANNVTSTTVGNTTSIPSFTFDQNGVITSASNTAISGAGITANTIANSAFQTGSVENYLRGANLDFGMRNRIINGAMVIDQRNANASLTITSDGLYTLDRWQAYSDVGTSKYSVQQNAGSVTPPVGFTNYLGVTSLATTSVGSADYYMLSQKIEGYNVADLGFGTANAKTVTLSFWVHSSLTGTFGGALTNGAGNRSYPFTYTISVANTWEYKTVTIAGDTSGTWTTNNTAGIILRIGLGVGSTSSGTAGAWAGSIYYSATGATSVVGTSGATFYITGVQLEVGTQATSFEYRQTGTELVLCQRYFEKSYNQDAAVPTATYNANNFKDTWAVAASRPLWDINFAVLKRANPTMVFYSPNSTTAGKCGGPSNADFNCTSNGSYQHSFQCYQSSGNSSATPGADYYLQWAASAEL